MRKCEISTCDNPYHASGVCQKHYTEARRLAKKEGTTTGKAIQKVAQMAEDIAKADLSELQITAENAPALKDYYDVKRIKEVMLKNKNQRLTAQGFLAPKHEIQNSAREVIKPIWERLGQWPDTLTKVLSMKTESQVREILLSEFDKLKKGIVSYLEEQEDEPEKQQEFWDKFNTQDEEN